MIALFTATHYKYLDYTCYTSRRTKLKYAIGRVGKAWTAIGSNGFYASGSRAKLLNLIEDFDSRY